jgi:hypothetical protein
MPHFTMVVSPIFRRYQNRQRARLEFHTHKVVSFTEWASIVDASLVQEVCSESAVVESLFAEVVPLAALHLLEYHCEDGLSVLSFVVVDCPRNVEFTCCNSFDVHFWFAVVLIDRVKNFL